MLDRAKFLLISEIAEVEGKTQATIEERVNKALNKTFAPRNRSRSRFRCRSRWGSSAPVRRLIGPSPTPGRHTETS